MVDIISLLQMLCVIAKKSFKSDLQNKRMLHWDNMEINITPKRWIFKIQSFVSLKVICSLTEKAMAPHSSTLAWRIPGTGEPGGLPSMWSHRVGHDWSDLAVAKTIIRMCVCVYGYIAASSWLRLQCPSLQWAQGLSSWALKLWSQAQELQCVGLVAL